MIQKLFLFALSLSLSVTTLLAERPTDDREKQVKIKTSAVCGMCKARIERNLAFEKGVKEASLDVQSKVLTVTYNPKKTDVAKIKSNVVKTGYDADELPADETGYNKLPSCCKKGGMDHGNHH